VSWAVLPDDGEDFETLMRSADKRMLALKGDGKQRALATPDRIPHVSRRRPAGPRLGS
jgi:hypothetical protein